MSTPRLHLAPTHPLATVAAEHCSHHQAPLLGGVACGDCWERAIRDDEQWAVVHDLPRDLTVDPDLIDWVAVERACRGFQVPLTPMETRAAVQRLHTQGMSQIRIAQHLRTSTRVVTEAIHSWTQPQLRAS